VRDVGHDLVLASWRSRQMASDPMSRETGRKPSRRQKAKAGRFARRTLKRRTRHPRSV